MPSLEGLKSNKKGFAAATVTAAKPFKNRIQVRSYYLINSMVPERVVLPFTTL